MADYNHVTLVGRLINEPEAKAVSDDRLRTGFTLAINRPYKDNNGKSVSDFFNIVAWGKLAEICKEYVKKGEDLLVDGRIQSRSYEQDNEKKWITEIIAESLSFLGRKNGNGKPKSEKEAVK
ncbi:single-stranded DNA-binding protein [Candidatus Margulisiibacteriota bacterium]